MMVNFHSTPLISQQSLRASLPSLRDALSIGSVKRKSFCKQGQ